MNIENGMLWHVYVIYLCMKNHDKWSRTHGGMNVGILHEIE